MFRVICAVERECYSVCTWGLQVCWNMTLSGLLSVYRRFGGTCCLHHPGGIDASIGLSLRWKQQAGNHITIQTDNCPGALECSLSGIWDHQIRGVQLYTSKGDLNDLYCSQNIIRVIKSRIMRWTGHVAHMRERRGVYMVLVGKHEGKRPLGRPKRRWEDNIMVDIQEVGLERHELDWSGWGLGQVAGICRCGNEPSDSIKYVEFLD